MRTFVIGFLCVANAFPQAADYANTRYKTVEGRAAVAQGLGAHSREDTQKPRDLIAVLKIADGSTVVDIGTGVGFMLPYLSEAVGPAGKIIAEDIFPDFLDKAKALAADKSLKGVTFVLGTEKDPKVPTGVADTILILDAYHHFDYPTEMLAAIRAGLKPGGRLAIVEFYKEGMGDPKHIRFTDKELVQEIIANGFELISQAPFIEKVQYVSLFRKK